MVRAVAGGDRSDGADDRTAVFSSKLGEPRTLALRPDGSVVVADYFHDRLHLIRGAAPTVAAERPRAA